MREPRARTVHLHRHQPAQGLGDWLIRANTRQHRSLGCRPADRWETDTAAMLDLPPVAPVTGWRLSPGGG